MCPRIELAYADQQDRCPRRQRNPRDDVCIVSCLHEEHAIDVRLRRPKRAR